MPKVKYISNGLKNRLRASVRKNRRVTIYKMLAKKNNGVVPCFVCGKPVEYDKATLEHIKPQSRGGTDVISNLAISHFQCNVTKGNLIEGIE